MSELQIALIVIGGLIIAGVLILNWWQERKFRRQLDSSFTTAQSDALFDDPKLDLDDLNIADDTADAFSFSSTDHADDLLDQANEPEVVNAASHLAQELPDAHIEHAAALTSEPDYSANQSPADVLKQKSQHVDIKTIFNDAFSQPGKLAASTPLADKPAASVLPAQDRETDAIKVRTEAPTQVEPAFEAQALTLAAALDSQIDLIAVLYLAKETAVNIIYDAFLSLLGGYDKTVFIHVLDANNQWHLLTETASDPKLANLQVAKLSCSLQLADRAGAVSRNTLNRFQLAVETLGLDINAHVEWQGNGDMLAAANALDAFCIEVDKTIGFSLLHGDSGPFTGTKLRGLAEAQGFKLAADGTFKYYDETQAQASDVLSPSFMMFNQDNYPFNADMLRNSVVKGVTFQLDIPHVKNCAEAYGQMVQIARQMSQGLNAILMASNNKVLGDIQIEKTRQQLQVIHATMLTRGVVPGSASALRLFS